jgi:hypothetical protein
VVGLVLILAAAFALYWAMSSWHGGKPSWLPYNEWASRTPQNTLDRIWWFLGDMTEAQFHKNVPGAIGLIVGAALAHWLYRRKSPACGFAICYGTGLWPSVFLASALGLFLSVFVFDFAGVLGSTKVGWVPTFVPFVSVPASIVFLYGPSVRSILTGGILGGLLGFPIAWFLIEKLLVPWGLPIVIGNVTSMCVAGIVCFEICQHLPWMRKVEKLASAESDSELSDTEKPTPTDSMGTAGWFVRRVLADFTEANFYGNEVASLGLLAGGIVGWLINPSHPAYGSGVFPALLASQFLASATGVFVYFNQWRRFGWYPTFVPVVSVAPAIVLMFGGTPQSILAGGILGGIIGPPVAHMVGRNVPPHWHPYVGNVFSMALSTAIVAAALMFMPGFGRPW